MRYIVMLKRKLPGKLEDKHFPVEAESAADAMIIAGKNPENEGFYVWGVRKGDSE